MSIIRVHKDKNYTVMSNVHLRDKNLSLKSKGLLSVMLSLPDDWKYSIPGLCSICKENQTAIKSAIMELKECGYVDVLKKNPNETESRKYEYIYDVYETPQPELIEKQKKAKEEKERKKKQKEVQNQGIENLPLENHTLNKSTKLLNTKLRNTDPTLSTDKAFYNKAFGSTQAEKEVLGNGTEKKLPYAYTLDELSDFMKNKVTAISGKIAPYLTADEIESITDILLQFYKMYWAKTGERHPILNDIAYAKIIGKILSPPEPVEEDRRFDVESYEEMMEVFFDKDYGKRSGNRTDHRISYFFTGKVFENLCWKEFYTGFPRSDLPEWWDEE